MTTEADYSTGGFRRIFSNWGNGLEVISMHWQRVPGVIANIQSGRYKNKLTSGYIHIEPGHKLFFREWHWRVSGSVIIIIYYLYQSSFTVNWLTLRIQQLLLGVKRGYLSLQVNIHLHATQSLDSRHTKRIFGSCEMWISSPRGTINCWVTLWTRAVLNLN